MKNLFVLIAIFLLCGYSYSQNTATVTETGDANTAFVDQLGSTNTATVTQAGDKNKADVNDMYVSTLYGLLTGTKGITQHGNGNTGTITQTNLFTGTVNAGPIAGIGQYNDNNTATILQSHNNSYFQEYAWAKQVGFGNTSLQTQVNNYAFSHISTTGNGNTATTDQQGGYSQKANILQTGDGNNAYQHQGTAGYTSTNLAEATQDGNGNASIQNQFGSSNIAQIVAVGDGNITNQEQNFTGSDAQIHVNGNANKITSFQSGSIPADVYQHNTQWINGNENTASINQTGAGHNYAFQWLPSSGVNDLNKLSIQQNGASNMADQTILGDNNGTLNPISINQVGNYNDSDIKIDGNFNEAKVLQTGNSNTGFITQTGNTNTGSITSFGDSNVGSITQTGSMNQAVITQNP